MSHTLYLRQVELGDMANYVYLIGSTRTKEAAVIDPAWEIDRIVELAEADGMRLTHILVTHTHPDHVGGKLFNLQIQGVAELLDRIDAQVVVHKAEADHLTPLAGSNIRQVDHGDTLNVGDVAVTMIHTPGHTPGSQCFLIRDRLITGDTLFIGSCGRVDLPGSSPEQMYDSLINRVMRLDDTTVVLPGHNYAAGRTSSSIGEERKTNRYTQCRSLAAFLRATGNA
ncbi:Beta-lactamase-like protein [Candidatus Methylomirabilis lanthanidiphila]|uniref:Beta-lactamase-like protein n=1 Tax=Candidatus Methylomirabilis lanthanidiphila TaxID=2211376 RepID=A0A564ZIZ7_9BACT|nr:MBL fold metallo-hydrolase [Candidatus Methylomirabilis lanthanidiphila]VUZ85066.1 Beta-lactamase-like protein [Candidatus Methylomirabilis lanthanidiphila]